MCCHRLLFTSSLPQTPFNTIGNRHTSIVNKIRHVSFDQSSAYCDETRRSALRGFLGEALECFEQLFLISDLLAQFLNIVGVLIGTVVLRIVADNTVVVVYGLVV